uniref:Sperm protein associated with the nucleus on the X chromosome N2 n=1 Tax=Cebus imitator TaxID=2715852 RepID=A0A2K5PVI4_CEBIM
MKKPTSSTKMKSISNNKKSDKTLETLNGALASEQILKKTKKSQYPTILVFYYRNHKKINSNQIENDQSQDNSINPIQDEEDRDLDLCEGSSQKDEDLDSWEGYSKEDKDLDPWEGSSQKDEDLNSCEGSSQEGGQD